MLPCPVATQALRAEPADDAAHADRWPDQDHRRPRAALHVPRAPQPHPGHVPLDRHLSADEARARNVRCHPGGLPPGGLRRCRRQHGRLGAPGLRDHEGIHAADAERAPRHGGVGAPAAHRADRAAAPGRVGLPLRMAPGCCAHGARRQLHRRLPHALLP